MLQDSRGTPGGQGTVPPLQGLVGKSPSLSTPQSKDAGSGNGNSLTPKYVPPNHRGLPSTGRWESPLRSSLPLGQWLDGLGPTSATTHFSLHLGTTALGAQGSPGRDTVLSAPLRPGSQAQLRAGHPKRCPCCRVWPRGVWSDLI